MGDGKRRRLRHDELQRILDAGDRSEIRKVIDEITKMLADTGMIIEAGWISMKIMAVPEDAPPVQIEEMRNAFFAGAQHLFGAIMTMLDPGEEPTEADLSRMDKIKDELDRFLEEFKLKHFEASGSA